MSETWIVFCLVVIGALYALLFATADSLHADERRRAKLDGDAVPPLRSETAEKGFRALGETRSR